MAKVDAGPNTQYYTKAGSPLVIPRGECQVKHYSIYDTEFDALSTWGWLVTAAISAAASILVFIAGIKWDCTMSAPVPKEKSDFIGQFTSILWVAFAAFVAISLFLTVMRIRLVHKIKKQHTQTTLRSGD